MAVKWLTIYREWYLMFLSLAAVEMFKCWSCSCLGKIIKFFIVCSGEKCVTINPNTLCDTRATPPVWAVCRLPSLKLLQLAGVRCSHWQRCCCRAACSDNYCISTIKSRYYASLWSCGSHCIFNTALQIFHKKSLLLTNEGILPTETLSEGFYFETGSVGLKTNI